jgi:glutathione S-transferase
MILYGHPFSSYTWKALIPLYEKGLDFEFRILDEEHPEHWEQLRALWPRGQMPVLDDGGRGVFESTILIEHLDLAYPDTPRMIPADPQAALRARLFDRVFDCHLEASFQAAVSEYIPFITETPDPARVERARSTLLAIPGWRQTFPKMAGRAAANLAWPIAQEPLRCFMPTGLNPFRTSIKSSKPTAPASIPGLRLRGA